MVLFMFKLQLTAWHERYAKMGEFAGWFMPLWYKGAIQEHRAVRENVGFFDISHMGELFVIGHDAEDFLNIIVTSDITKIRDGKSKYTVICNERGAVKDDVVVYRFNKEKYMIICNAVNRDKVSAWIKSLLMAATLFGDIEIDFFDGSFDHALFAVQGPEAPHLAELMGIELPGSFSFNRQSIDDIDVLVSRTGYTGEDGFEVLIQDRHPFHPDKDKRGEPKRIKSFFSYMLDAGKDISLEACGLFARDTLRLEAGFTLYGNDMWEKQLPARTIDSLTPFECGLGFCVDMDKKRFIGKEALELRQQTPEKSQILLRLMERGIPRPHCKVFKDNTEIGMVTSGSLVPTTPGGIAIALVRHDSYELGDILEIEIRGKKIPARVVKKPFYNPEKYGKKRKSR